MARNSRSIAALKFLAAALGASFVLTAAAQQPPQAVMITIDGPVKINMDPSRSGAYCGGRGQQECPGVPAKFEQAAQGTCPAGTVFDIGKWQCWSCPSGFGRSFDPIDSERACMRDTSGGSAARLGGREQTYSQATFRGRLCPSGSFYDPIRGGECYSCPSGYRRSAAHIDLENACFIPAGENFAKATRQSRTPWPHECARGTFHDGWDGGGCWTCPSGYRRTGFHVNAPNACAASVGEKWAKATLVKQARCEPGELQDLRIQGAQDVSAGGGCWTCPPSTRRSQFPIDGDRACAQAVGLEYTRAKFDSALTCPAGQHFDFISLTADDIRTRPELKDRRNVKPIESGTCWSCPAGYARGVQHVKSGNACWTHVIGWYSAPFREPGLFGLAGAAEVLAEVTKGNPALVRLAIAKAAESVARANKVPVAQVLEQENKNFVADPANSVAAASVVFTRLLAAIAEPQKASAAEKRALESFRQYIIARRVHIAQDAIDHLTAYRAAVAYRREQEAIRNKGRPTDHTLEDIFVKGPDFTTSGLLATLFTEAGVIAAGQLSVIGEVVASALREAGGGFEDFHHPAPATGNVALTAAQIALGVAIEKAMAAMAAQALITKLSQSAMGMGAMQGLNVTHIALSTGTLAKMSTGARILQALSNAGPQIVLALGMTFLSMYVESAVEYANAPKVLNTALVTAKTDPNLSRLAATEAGMVELLTYWSYATAGTARPQPQFFAMFTPFAVQAVTSTDPKSVIARATAGAGTASATTGAGTAPATTGVSPSRVTWTKIADAGRDIAIGANGTVWRIGNDPQPGGFGIYRLDGANWTKIPGGGVQIAVDPQGNAWVVTSARTVLRFDGKDWTPVPGTAQAIAIGANGAVWAIGADAKPGGFGIYRWDGRAWANVAGGGVKIAVDPLGNPIVVTSAGTLHRYDGKQWTQIPGAASGIAIGPKNHVWILGTSSVSGGGFGVLTYSGKDWTPVPAPRGFTSLAVAPDGTPWGVNSGQEVVRVAGPETQAPTR